MKGFSYYDIAVSYTHLDVYKRQGVYIASSQFEAMFISDAHTDEEIQHTLNIMHNYFEK